MKEYIKNYLFPERLILNQLDKVFFEYDIYSENSKNISKFNVVLMIGLFLILIFDFIQYLNGKLIGVQYELAKTHIVFFFTLLIFFFTTKFVIRNIKANLFFRVYFMINATMISGIVIWTSLIDQLANGQITVMIMGFFGISILLYLYPIDSFLLYTISTIVFFLLLPEYQKDQKIIISHYINVPFLTLLSFFISYSFFRNKVIDFMKSKKLEEVNNTLDELVNRILPPRISYELRKSSIVKPTLHEKATVVFIDFVGFSRIVNHTDINIVITTLENLFSEFDKIVKKYGLEKIKTIGDSYMFAGGLFGEPDHIEKCVECSLDIIELIEKNKEILINTTGYEWNVRIGIDSGPVISGVIGDWRFLFDIWGNTVNVASRLESSCEPLKVNISKSIYEELKNYKNYTFEARGNIPIKNIGNIEMYYVSRVKEGIEL